MLIFITGISTSGKTTIGREFVKSRRSLHEKWVFKDLDEFYLPKKPLVTLSNGKVKENWDCYEALDYDAVQKFVKEHFSCKKPDNLCFVGFALCTEKVGRKPDYHFHLILTPLCENKGIFDDDLLSDIIASNRQITKGFKGDKAENDKRMIKEYLIPFYKTVLNDIGEEVVFLNTNPSEETKWIDEMVKVINMICI